MPSNTISSVVITHYACSCCRDQCLTAHNKMHVSQMTLQFRLQIPCFILIQHAMHYFINSFFDAPVLHPWQWYIRKSHDMIKYNLIQKGPINVPTKLYWNFQHVFSKLRFHYRFVRNFAIFISINGKKSPLYLRTATYEVFLLGSTMKNDHVTFSHTRWHVNAKKKPVSIANLFCDIWALLRMNVFPLGAFSDTDSVWQCYKNPGCVS